MFFWNSLLLLMIQQMFAIPLVNNLQQKVWNTKVKVKEKNQYGIRFVLPYYNSKKYISLSLSLAPGQTSPNPCNFLNNNSKRSIFSCISFLSLVLKITLEL